MTIPKLEIGQTKNFTIKNIPCSLFRRNAWHYVVYIGDEGIGFDIRYPDSMINLIQWCTEILVKPKQFQFDFKFKDKKP